VSFPASFSVIISLHINHADYSAVPVFENCSFRKPLIKSKLNYGKQNASINTYRDMFASFLVDKKALEF